MQTQFNCQGHFIDQTPKNQTFIVWNFCLGDENNSLENPQIHQMKTQLKKILFECFSLLKTKQQGLNPNKCFTVWWGDFFKSFQIAVPFRVKNQFALLLERKFQNLSFFVGSHLSQPYCGYLNPCFRYESGKVIDYCSRIEIGELYLDDEKGFGTFLDVECRRAVLL